MSIDYLLSKTDLRLVNLSGMSVKELIVKACLKEADFSREKILSAIESPKAIKFSVDGYDFSFIVDV